jgi:hypothetical protein
MSAEAVRAVPCPRCDANPRDLCNGGRGYFGGAIFRRGHRNHRERVALCRELAAITARTGRRYFDARTTPYGMQVCTHECEHCDGEHSRMVRIDDLRGFVCPSCDSALDEMLHEDHPE